MFELLEDPRLISRLSQARSELIAEGREVCGSSLAQAVGMNVMVMLYGINRQQAWDQLGLDHDTECLGPHAKKH